MAQIPVAPAVVRPPTPPLFRRTDWLSLVVTFLFVFITYFLTIAPEMTLEDSGELATGSFYAGIPHPPGYPVWTIYTYLWTLLPIGNVAWRVGLGVAFSGAVSAALLAFVVSRGSSMIIESIDAFKNIDRRWENAICVVSGFVAGSLIGLNGYMWSQSVIVEVYPLSVASLLGVVLCLLRWIYAPHQHRYLYWSFFLYGICFNNHQSLLVIAMGLEVLVLCAEPKLGREMCAWNTLIYVLGVVVQPDILWANIPVRVIFNIIGIASAVTWFWLVLKTKKKGVEFAIDGLMLAVLGCAALFFGGITGFIFKANSVPALVLIAAAGISALVFLIHLKQQNKSYIEWYVALASGGSWLAGAAFYFYMPIAGMTDPPMQWAYPRTVEGFIHAMTRGQYEKIHPTSGSGDNLFDVVGNFFGTYGTQLWRFVEGLNEEFTVLLLLVSLVVFLFYRQMKRRERAWILGLIAIFICLGPFLVLLLNFPSDRQSLSLNRVFLTSAHVFVSLFVGYGLTLIAALIATSYETSRKYLLIGGICAVDIGLFYLISENQKLLGGLDAEIASRLAFGKMLCWLFAIGSIFFVRKNNLENDHLLAKGLPGLFVVISVVFTIVALLESHLSGAGVQTFFSSIPRWFSPDQYALPMYAGLILLGLSVVFLFRIATSRTQAPIGLALALFAALPSYSLMTHWFENEMRGHWFGYWFGHDMFTPPFTGPDGKLTYDPDLRKKALAGSNAKLVYPEMDRDTILFGGTDPGRFAPTYMIFCDSFIPHKDLPEFDQNFDRRDVYLITQNALADGHYLEYLRAQYFRSQQKDPLFFQELLRPAREKEENYTTNVVARVAAKVLDEPLTRRGARIEARWRKEGVYPPNEIYIPSNEDSQVAFQQYMSDAQARILHDQQLPNEPRQVKPGEDVRLDPNSGRVQVSGQIAVMAINGLLTKVIFEHNPTNEFYVEESFPLDWMFPHLTPFGIIMKINRQPVPAITEDMANRDHEFWSKFSDRLIGNWITYDTPVSEICKFAEKVYLRHDFSGFKGDRRFVRDDSAQKAFSKLRSSIGGIYSWRIGMSPAGGPVPPQYTVHTEAERQRMIKEADFAYKQSFAFCPYSPEAVFRYVNLLLTTGRMEDAMLVAETCLKLDSYNDQVKGLIKNLEGFRKQSGAVSQAQNQIATLENELRANPSDFQKAFDLASKYLSLQQNDRAIQILDDVLKNPKVNVNAALGVAQAFAQMQNSAKLETALEKLAQLSPDSPETWYDLAASKAMTGKPDEALKDLRRALELNGQRLAKNPATNDLRNNAATDQRFAAMRSTPEFQALVKK
jgi:tetratricopeptide (TPR) repeat protein